MSGQRVGLHNVKGNSVTVAAKEWRAHGEASGDLLNGDLVAKRLAKLLFVHNNVPFDQIRSRDASNLVLRKTCPINTSDVILDHFPHVPQRSNDRISAASAFGYPSAFEIGTASDLADVLFHRFHPPSLIG